MKQTKLYILTIGLLLGALLLTACSSDALPGDDGGIKEVCRTDSCYINLRIVNTSQARTRTRAVEAATSAENAIYDGILCIFEGTSESAATLKSAVAIDQLLNNSTDDSGVGNNGTSVNVIQQLPLSTYSYTNNLYALVLLNTTESGFSVSGNTLKLNGTSFPNTTTINDIRNSKINSVGSTDKHVGLFMSNAPQDGYIMPVITTLFDTETAARAPEAARVTINVERAAAKVSVTKVNTGVSGIILNGKNSSRPSVHAMTWTLNKYNTKSNTVRNGSTSAVNWAQDWNYSTAPENTYTAKDFAVYPQHSHSSDVVYVAENTTSDGTSTDANVTEAIVEVQLKDDSNMLMHECFVFHPFQDTFMENSYTELYTSRDQYIAYLKAGLTEAQKSAHGLGGKTSAEVFKYPTITIGENGTVSITLVNESFSAEDQTHLASLASWLSERTTGFRDGKMYYTYKIKHTGPDSQEYGVVRNNAYNLTLTNGSISRIGRPTP